ncbi:hypothetical protein ACJX0J_040478, partial [Zea mays]
ALCARTATRTAARLRVPEPRQLRHAARPDPAHVLHPTSPSDHRAQGHATFPVPPHAAQYDPRAPPPAPASGGGGLHAEHHPPSAAAWPTSAPSPADAASTMGPSPTISQESDGVQSSCCYSAWCSDPKIFSRSSIDVQLRARMQCQGSCAPRQKASLREARVAQQCCASRATGTGKMGQ